MIYKQISWFNNLENFNFKGREVITNDTEGSLKRCGGIGDLLTGTLGTFFFWTHQKIAKNNRSSENDKTDATTASESQSNILAAYAGSVFVRECSRVAFEKYHRSILAVDVIEQMPQTFYQMFDS
jgi:ATP-dependent NAD(P)H-hydrate dehydratase